MGGVALVTLFLVWPLCPQTGKGKPDSPGSFASDCESGCVPHEPAPGPWRWVRGPLAPGPWRWVRGPLAPGPRRWVIGPLRLLPATFCRRPRLPPQGTTVQRLGASVLGVGGVGGGICRGGSSRFLFGGLSGAF